MQQKPEKQTKRAGRLIWRIVIIILISLTLGGTIYSINAKRVVHDAMPMPFGFGLSVVLSGSMEDTLHVNDLVFVRATQDVAVNDIVVYQSGQDLIIHRVIDRSGDVITTKGDANNVADEEISIGAIKGKMLFSVPMIGFAVRLLQTTLGKLVVILLAVCLLLRSHRKEKEQDDAQLDRIKEEIRKLREEQEQEETGSGEAESETKES